MEYRVDARIDAVTQMARKHRVGPEDLPELLQTLRSRLDELILRADPEALADVFVGLNVVRAFEPPLPVPAFPLNQHWHPRFHHDPAIIWLRESVKKTFENYPRIVTDDAEQAQSSTRS